MLHQEAWPSAALDPPSECAHPGHRRPDRFFAVVGGRAPPIQALGAAQHEDFGFDIELVRSLHAESGPVASRQLTTTDHGQTLVMSGTVLVQAVDGSADDAAFEPQYCGSGRGDWHHVGDLV